MLFMTLTVGYRCMDTSPAGTLCLTDPGWHFFEPCAAPCLTDPGWHSLKQSAAVFVHALATPRIAGMPGNCDINAESCSGACGNNVERMCTWLGTTFAHNRFGYGRSLLTMQCWFDFHSDSAQRQDKGDSATAQVWVVVGAELVGDLFRIGSMVVLLCFKLGSG